MPTVSLDCLSQWFGIIIEWSTGVIYHHQVGGTSCEQRYIEGFYVTLNGYKNNVDEEKVASNEFTQLFHLNDGCYFGWPHAKLPELNFKKLSKLVEDLFPPDLGLTGDNKGISINLSRRDEMCEAWIPVLIGNLTGVLVFNNCD